MNEEELLKKFAKALGAEDTLEKIEKKKINEENMLKGMAKLLGTESLLEEIENKKANEQALIEEKREKERKMLEQMNAALARLVNNNPEHAEVIQQEVEETIAIAVQEEEEPVAVVENASQPQPELPKDDIVTKSVTAISKAAPGEIQKVVDALPAGIRKELDVIKRSITDLHRFATNHSQLGGGGEVKLARLDDVDATSIADGLYLRYDLANNMFVFDAPAGGNGGGSDGISVTNAAINGNGSLIITYSNLVTSNAGYVIGSNGAAGANGADGSNGISITSSVVNGAGFLTITYSNNYVANSGYVLGSNGSNGANGANGADGSNGISVTSAVVNGNGSLIITYSNTTTANAGYVVGGASITLNQPGYVSGPMTGQSRFYPSINTSITAISASVSEAVVSANVQFKVFKNGADTGPTYSINIGNYQLVSTAASIDLTTSDYLTLNMVAGTAFDLRVNFK